MADRRPTIPDGRLAAKVAAFELGLHLRSPVFWIVVAISGLMVTASLTVERIQVGPLRPGGRTTTEAILYVHLVWSLFFLFTAAAFMADAALRDERTGFAAIVRATPTSPAALAAGRFAGALTALLLSFASVPLATALAPWLPLGTSPPPPDPAAILYGTVVLAVPNLVLAGSVFFALATRASSALAAYLGAVALLVLYGLGAGGGTAPDASPSAWLADPFGFAAYRHVTAGWSDADRATALPGLAGPIAWNRVLWFGVTGLAVALGIGGAGRPVPDAAVPARREPSGATPPRSPIRSAAGRSFGARTTGAQLAARIGLEFGLVLRSPFLAVLLLLGLASAAGAIWQGDGGSPLHVAAARVDEAFRLVPIVVATFYAGELVWGERDAGMSELVGATPVPDWILLAPKVLALGLILAASILSLSAAASLLDLARSGDAGRFAGWFALYGLPRSFDAVLVAILAVFLQAVAPGKLAGFGLMVLYLIASLGLESAGLHGDLYRYGGSGEALSITSAGPGPALLVRAYWGAAALLLLVLAHALVGRGIDSRLGHRLRRLPSRLRGMPGFLAAIGAVAWAVLGVAVATSP